MTTLPWSPDTPTLLAMGDADAVGGMAHTALIIGATADGETIDLPVIDGTLRYDESTTPRVRLSLTTHLIDNMAVEEALDPRLDTRVNIAVGYIRPDGVVDLQPVADLGLRSRVRSRPEDTLALEAASDEALFLDNTVSASITVSTTTTTDAITDIIHMCLPSAVVNITTGSAGAGMNETILDADKWDVMMDLADRDGPWVVYDDGTRVWQVADRPTTPDTANVALTLKDGPGGTLTQLTDSMDREGGWYNRVKTLYQWNDGTTDHRVVAVQNATGTYAPTVGNVRTLEVARDLPTDATKAGHSATAMVGRTVTRGRSFTLTAPSTYWLRPGQTIRVEEAGRDPFHTIVAAVTFDLVSGLMDIDTREFAY